MTSSTAERLKQYFTFGHRRVHGQGEFSQKTRRGKAKKATVRTHGPRNSGKAEVDGDLHIQLVDEAAQDDDVNVSLRSLWRTLCDIRKGVVQLDHSDVSFKTPQEIYASKASRHYRTGKAFSMPLPDGGEPAAIAPGARTRATTKNVAFEIHPVMNLEVIAGSKDAPKP